MRFSTLHLLVGLSFLAVLGVWLAARGFSGIEDGDDAGQVDDVVVDGPVELICIGEDVNGEPEVPRPGMKLAEQPTAKFSAGSADQPTAEAAVEPSPEDEVQLSADDLIEDEQTQEQIRTIMRAEMAVAAVEDYEGAKACNLMLAEVRQAASKLRALEKEKQAAAKNRDYDKAIALKAEAQKLRVDHKQRMAGFTCGAAPAAQAPRAAEAPEHLAQAGAPPSKTPHRLGSRLTEPPPGCADWKKRRPDTLHPTGTLLPLPGEYDNVLPMWRKFKKEGINFPLNAKSIARASAPASYTGNHYRLRKAALKMLRGEPLVVSVLGGSMTRGMRGDNQLQYPFSRLVRYFFDLIGYNVSVKNAAARASNVQWAIGHFGSIYSAISQSDIVIVDYAVNVNGPSETEERKWLLAQQSFRQLIVMLAGMPNSPAVIDFESYYPGRKYFCSANVTKWVHWDTAREMDIPVWSYLDGVCHEDHTFWVLKDNGEMDDSAHPSQVTHDLIARMIVGIYAQEVDDVCVHGQILSEDTQAGAIQKRVGVSPIPECLAKKPLTDMLARRDGSQGFNLAGMDRRAWGWRADMKKWRQGFGAQGEGRIGDIGFVIATGQGYIQVEYVGSNKIVGDITCWLDDKEPHPGNSCLLKGWWPINLGSARFFYMKTTGPSGRHVLWCRSDGKPFKLWGIVTC